MALFFYNLFVVLYATAIRIASLWNSRAKKWVDGRKVFPAFPNPTGEPVIWMHCASLGEFEQGRPLIEALRSDSRFNNNRFRIVVSFFSPSGFEVMKDYPHADQVIYLPLDSKANAVKLIDQLKPTIVLWVKYEFWYHYLSELQKRKIPVLLISGIFREGQPFFKWYGKLWKEMLSKFSLLFLQNKHSAELLKDLENLPEKMISGDTRFDRVVAIAGQETALPEIARFIVGHKVIVAGSTWEEDEAELIHYAKTYRDVKIIIAPHMVDKQNIKDVKSSFTGSVLYSDYKTQQIDPASFNVLIIDNVGMLSKLYRYASVAYVGGGFGDDGVHNVLEAAVYGIPVLHGPEFDKYAEAVELVECGGSIVVNSAVELEKILAALFKDDELRVKHGSAARKYVYGNAGATNKILDHLYEKRLLTS